jgi:hypothetical protein
LAFPGLTSLGLWRRNNLNTDINKRNDKWKW